jgi:UrcA family protein
MSGSFLESDMKAARPTAFRALPLLIAVVAGGCMNPVMTAGASDLGGAPTSRTVQVRAADLSTPERVAALYRRIRNAARSVCGYADNRFREEQAAWDACVNQAIGRAVARVASADLTDYYLARAKPSGAVPGTDLSKVVERVPSRG